MENHHINAAEVALDSGREARRWLHLDEAEGWALESIAHSLLAIAEHLHQ